MFYTKPLNRGFLLYIPEIYHMLFGGEGIFNTVLTGPGRVWLQTMPIYNVANAIRPYLPTSSN